jgi:hypothetical protein
MRVEPEPRNVEDDVAAIGEVEKRALEQMAV